MIKKLLVLNLLVVGFTVSASAQNLFFETIRLQKNELTTVEKCRRHFTKTRCCDGDIEKVPYLEITYVTTDKCGKAVEWKKVYKTGGATTAAGVPIDRNRQFDERLNRTLSTIINPTIVRKIIGVE